MHRTAACLPQKSHSCQKYPHVVTGIFHQVYMYQRPRVASGGLWSFPEVDTRDSLNVWCQNHGLVCQAVTELDEFRHTFSHFHLDIQPMLISVKPNLEGRLQDSSDTWYDLLTPPQLGLSAPAKKLIEQLQLNLLSRV